MRKQERKSNKIAMDKYYTPKDLAEYVVNKTHEVIDRDNITEYVESSAGNGVFLDVLDDMNISSYLAYDIEPEDDKGRVVKQDYLELDLEYKKGRCVIGNPPFGLRNILAVKFYKKSIQIGDYIAFILPISQLNNNMQMYEFDMVYSEDLDIQTYADRDLHCCFNIYRRNTSGGLNKKPNHKLKDIEIRENRRTGHQIGDFKYDIGFCSFGKGIIGRIPKEVGQYAKEFYIKVHKEGFRGKVVELVESTDWENDVCNGISGQTNLAQWQVYKYLKEQIPELE